jgi:hypothetical protein
MNADYDVLLETQRKRRGHRFYPTKPCRSIPALYSTDDTSARYKVLHLHYFAGPCDWWIAEYDPATGTAFGYVNLNCPQDAEWGVIDLTALEPVTVSVHGNGIVVVQRDLDWTPRLAGAANLPGRWDV